MVSDGGREDWLIDRLEGIGVVQRSGHFVAKSGLHFDCYIAKDIVTSKPVLTDELANLFVMLHHGTWANQVDLVVAPASGAILFGGMLAQHLGCDFAYTDKVSGRQVLRPSFANMIDQETKVLLAEDIVTRGKTLGEVAEEIRPFEAEILGAAVIWNRGKTNLPFPVHALINKELPAWSEDTCPLCKQGMPFNKDLGHANDFLLKYGANPKYWPANKVGNS